MKVLAVKMPADCPLRCDGCRNPIHGVGDFGAVLKTVKSNIAGSRLLYCTGNGDVGTRPDDLKKLLEVANDTGVPMSVLCAIPASIIEGLAYAEISEKEGLEYIAEKAVAKAKKLGVRPFITVVDRPGLRPIEQIAEDYDVDAVLVRQKQPEGLSSETFGTTRLYKRPSAGAAIYPIEAYPEVEGFGFRALCVGVHGQVIPSLGGAYVNM